MSNINTIPVEFNGEEAEAMIEATSDRVVTSCDLLSFTLPDNQALTVVIDAEFRTTPIGQAFSLLWEAITQEAR